MSEKPEQRARQVTRAVIALGAAVLWLPALGRSFWLDETGTFWVVSGDLHETVDRASRFQGQSPVFFVIEWLARIVGNGRELVMRAPSVLFMAIAAILVYRLTLRLANQCGALIACAAFVTSWKIVEEANNARPYALATFTVVAAMLSLVRWFESGRTRDAAAYVVFAALTIYAHYLFGVMFLVHVAFAIEMRARTRVRLVHVVGAAVAIAILLLPLLPQFMAVLGKRGTYSWAGTPKWTALAMAIVPPVTALGVSVGVLVAVLALRGRLGRPTRPPLFIVVWLLAPVVLLFAVSRLTPTKLFTPQYVMASEPAVAVLLGCLLRDLRPRYAAAIVAIALVGATLASHHWRPVASEDWRGAVADIRALRTPTTGVMCDCGFVEAGHLEYLTDPQRVAFLNAPLAAYPPGTDVMRLPGSVESPELARYAEDQLTRFLLHDRIFFLGRGNAIEMWRPWLVTRLGPLGYVARATPSHRGVSLILFERPLISR